MSTYGYYRLAVVTPRVRVADVSFNVEELVQCAKAAAKGGAHVVACPELCLTGASCGDLFFQPRLQQAALRGLTHFAAETARLNVVVLLGMPLVVGTALFNVAVVVQRGRVLGVVPKSEVPCHRAAGEARWFRPARELIGVSEVSLPGFGEVPLGTNLLFSDGGDLVFSVEVGDDARSVMPPSSAGVLQGACVVFNLSAEYEQAGGASKRRALVKQQSARCLAVYAMASAGVGESTQDGVCSGHSLVAENGRIVAESACFEQKGSLTYADVDVQRLAYVRMGASSFNDCRARLALPPYRWVALSRLEGCCDLSYAWLPPRPFVPAAEEMEERCEEILSMQAAALARRVQHSHARTMVIGISGGLDSTLALMVCARVCKQLEISPEKILAVTMPGFGTTGRTYRNAVEMIRLVGASFKEINIKEACLLHFRDLDFDPSLRTNTYENVQARERTKILMNLANKTGGMVVGTGDLSEVALGWSTYNGDHMSMYGVNCDVPKSLIRSLLAYEAASCGRELAATLQDVIDTPVSPELLPPAEDGTMEQKTEDILGPYDIHDFLLYHFIKYGAEPTKLRILAQTAFAGEYSEELIGRTLEMFLRRFFTQQFKRSCVPDGPKVGSVALSPRADWRMPSDACATEWKP